MTTYYMLMKVLKAKWLHCQWWCDKRIDGEQEPNWIRVNPKASTNLTSVIVHELIHQITSDSDWSEEDVLAKEEAIMKRLTKRQAVAILKEFVRKAVM